MKRKNFMSDKAWDMSKGYEMYEGVESAIDDLLQYYNNLEPCTDCEQYRKEGAISALEQLLEILNK